MTKKVLLPWWDGGPRPLAGKNFEGWDLFYDAEDPEWLAANLDWINDNVKFDLEGVETFKSAKAYYKRNPTVYKAQVERFKKLTASATPPLKKSHKKLEPKIVTHNRYPSKFKKEVLQFFNLVKLFYGQEVTKITILPDGSIVIN